MSNNQDPLIQMNRSDPGDNPFVQQPHAVPIGPSQGDQLPANQAPLAQNNRTDMLGITSLILAFAGLQLIGFIIGVLGIRKAKKEGYSGVMSVVGVVLNAVLGLLTFGAIVLLLYVISVDIETTRRDNDAKTLVDSVYTELDEFYLLHGFYPENLRADQDIYGYFIAQEFYSNPKFSYKPSVCIQGECQVHVISYELEYPLTDHNGNFLENGFYERHSYGFEETTPGVDYDLRELPSISL